MTGQVQETEVFGMKFFPVGERPREVPEWFRKEMERVGMPASMPLWFLGG